MHFIITVRRPLSAVHGSFRYVAVQFEFGVCVECGRLFQEDLETFLHSERHEVFARDDADDVVVNVDDDQVSQSQSSEDDVRPIQRVVLVDLRHRYVDERFLPLQQTKKINR